MEERINVAINLRKNTSGAIAKIIREHPSLSEVEFRDHLAKELFDGITVHKVGWYNPPPQGIAALFCAYRNSRRTYFDSLRKEEFWPKEDNQFKEDSVAMIYASPVDKETGMIGDIALSITSSKNEALLTHFQQSLSVVETIAEQAKVGMSFGELVDHAQDILKKSGLAQTSFVSTENKLIQNIGHTIPWSYEDPTAEEHAIIKGDDFDTLKNLISKKRIFLDANQDFRIPETICFTVEMNIHNPNDLKIPSVYYHILVSFIGGEKTIFTHFDPILQAAGMSDSITSKYH